LVGLLDCALRILCERVDVRCAGDRPLAEALEKWLANVLPVVIVCQDRVPAILGDFCQVRPNAEACAALEVGLSHVTRPPLPVSRREIPHSSSCPTPC